MRRSRGAGVKGKPHITRRRREKRWLVTYMGMPLVPLAYEKAIAFTRHLNA